MGFGTAGQRKRESLGPGFRPASAVVRLWHTFTFEKSCYARIWPDDRRPPNGNRWTRPASRSLPTFQASLQGRRRLLTGDLYITESPPELLSAGAQDQARRRRPPTPRRQCLVKEFLAGARKPGFTPASPSAEPVPLYRILRRRAVGGGGTPTNDQMGENIEFPTYNVHTTYIQHTYNVHTTYIQHRKIHCISWDSAHKGGGGSPFQKI